MPNPVTITIPSPGGGWNARDALDAMSPQDAVRLNNLYPKGTSLEMRRGFAQHSTGMTATVGSLFEHADPDGTRTLIAAANNKLWNVSSAGTAAEITGGTVTTTDLWQGVQFKGKLILVNGVTKPQQIDKTTRSDADYGEIADPTTIVYPWVFKDRLYFVPVDSQSFWYGGVSEITGDLVEFDVGPFLTRGGALLWGESASKSTGTVAEDAVVLCSEKGEILIYTGTYPGGTFWLSNRFYIGEPLGRRSAVHVPGDLLILTEEGVVSLTSLMRGELIYDAFDKISNEWETLGRNYKDNIGWSGVYYPTRKQTIVNVPLAQYNAGSGGDAPEEMANTNEWWAMMVEWADYIAKPGDSYLDDTLNWAVTVTAASPAAVTFVTPGLGGNCYNGQVVIFDTSDTLPAGLSPATAYYMRNLSTDTYNVSLTPSGALINCSDTGTGTHYHKQTDWGNSSSFIYSGTYYDGENNMYQIADHEDDTATYYPYADEVNLYYQTAYVEPAGGQTLGYNMFPKGLAERYIRQSDTTAQDAVELLLTNGVFIVSGDCSFCNGDLPIYGDGGSREAAYALQTFIEAERAGLTLTGAQEARRDVFFQWCLDHIDQYTPELYGGLGTCDFYRPFLGGLTAHVLIDYYTYVDADSRIIPYLIRLANYTWDSCWLADDAAFTYTDRETGDPDGDRVAQPPLNMLVMPMFAWLWYQTGVSEYRTKANLIFQGSIPVYEDAVHVSGPSLGGRSKANPYGKIYNQQMFWGPSGVTWANSAALVGGYDAGETATSTKAVQVIQNHRSKALCKFTGMQAACWLSAGAGLYFGGDGGVVYQADSGQDDNDALIEISYKSSFSYAGQPNNVKHFDAVRPLVRAIGDVQLSVGIDTEFRDEPLTGTINLSLSSPPPWESVWESTWGGSKNLREVWANTTGIGYAGAVKIQASVKNTDIELHAVQLRVNPGGEI